MFSKIIPKSKNKKRKVETSLIEEFYYPKYGPGQLWEIVSTKIEEMGGVVFKNSKVLKLNFTDKNQIESIDYENEDAITNIKADYFISSMPVKDLVIAMGERVPHDIQTIAKWSSLS